MSAPLSGRTEDVSCHSILVQTEADLGIGQTVTVSITTPALAAAIEVSGTVARVREAGAQEPRAVAIRATQNTHRKRLAELVLVACVSPAPERPMKILFVEDNPHVIDVYRGSLGTLQIVRSGALRLLFASDGHQAWEIITTERPELIVTDLYLPILDGFDLIRRVRDDPEQGFLPIVAVSGGQSDEQSRCLELGADVFLEKPVQVGRFVEAIAEALGHSMSRSPRPSSR